MYKNWEASLSTLMKASRKGNFEEVKQQLQSNNQDIHNIDQNRGNALYWAVVSGHANLLRLLLDHGIDPLMKTRKNENLLHMACKLGHFHLVRVLIYFMPADSVRMIDNNDKTPLDYIIENKAQLYTSKEDIEELFDKVKPVKK